MIQKFNSGDRAIVLPPTKRDDFLIHLLKVGSEVEIDKLYVGTAGWRGHEAYTLKGTTEILLAEELAKKNVSISI